jgi:hypothetical protein
VFRTIGSVPFSSARARTHNSRHIFHFPLPTHTSEDVGGTQTEESISLRPTAALGVAREARERSRFGIGRVVWTARVRTPHTRARPEVRPSTASFLQLHPSQATRTRSDAGARLVDAIVRLAQALSPLLGYVWCGAAPKNSPRGGNSRISGLHGKSQLDAPRAASLLEGHHGHARGLVAKHVQLFQ